jgi:putative flippase GtrA
MNWLGALMAGHLFRYGVSGVGSTLLDLAMVYGLLALKIEANLAVSLGFVAGLLANFLLHRSYTFQHRAAVNWRQVLRFGMIVVVNYLLTLLIVNLVVHFDANAVFLGKLLSIPVVTANAYLLTRKYVFSREHGPVIARPKGPWQSR